MHGVKKGIVCYTRRSMTWLKVHEGEYVLVLVSNLRSCVSHLVDVSLISHFTFAMGVDLSGATFLWSIRSAIPKASIRTGERAVRKNVPGGQVESCSVTDEFPAQRLYSRAPACSSMIQPLETRMFNNL
jgi:hypothetical protein